MTEPNGTLEEVRAFVREFQRIGQHGAGGVFFPPENVLRFVDLVAALDVWLAGGGVLPSAWSGPAYREALQERLVALLRLTEELADDCDERADCSLDYDGARPNFAMQCLVKIRAVVPGR